MMFFRHGRRLPHWVFTLLLAIWSGLLGWGLTQIQPSLAQSAGLVAQQNPAAASEPAQLQLGQSLYLDTCASCHLAVPPQVLPTETWGILLSDPNHYGITLSPLVNPERALIWRYLQTFSRPLNPDEQTPYRIERSRYFQILHPEVAFSEPIRMESCVTCHPRAPEFDFQTLTAAWRE